MISRIIRYIYYLLFLLTPLIFSPTTSELFEFNKMLFIYTVAATISFLWIVRMVIAKRVIFKTTPIDIPIGLYVAGLIASTIFSIDRHTSIFGYYGRFNGGLLSIIAYLVLYWGFVSNVGRKYVERILQVSIISSLIVILWGFPGHFGADMTCFVFAPQGGFSNSCWTAQFQPSIRMFSTLGQPNWLGAYLAIHFFIALYFYLKSIHVESAKESILVSIKKNLSSKTTLFYFTYLIFNFVGLLFTRSRSAALASAISLLGFIGYYLLTKRGKAQSILRSFLPLIAVFFIAILIFKTGIEPIDKYISLRKAVSKPTAVVVETFADSDITGSGKIREIVWSGALELGRRYPLFGTGLETFAYSYYGVRPVAHNLTSEWDFLYNKAHNEYLNFLATTGFVGLGMYILMIVAVIYLFVRTIKKHHDSGLFGISLLAAYTTILITNFFGFSTTTINIFFFLIPAFIVVFSAKESDIVSDHSEHMSLTSWALIVLSGFVLLLTYSYLYSYYVADTKYALSKQYAQAGDSKTEAGLLQQALRLRREHVYEDKLSFALANLAYVYQGDKKGARALVALSQRYNALSLLGSPKNVLYFKTRAKNYYLYYQLDSNPQDIQLGIDALGEAKRLSPTDPKIPYSASIFYSLMADAAKDQGKKKEFRDLSLAQIGESIALKPNYSDAYLIKAQLLKKYGDKAGAKTALKYLLKNIDPKDEQAQKELEKLK